MLQWVARGSGTLFLECRAGPASAASSRANCLCGLDSLERARRLGVSEAKQMRA